MKRIGADDFMRKPFSRTEVFERIEALLDDDDIPRHGAGPATRTPTGTHEADGNGR